MSEPILSGDGDSLWLGQCRATDLKGPLMSRWKPFVPLFVFLSASIAVGQITEKWQKRLGAIEETYTTAISKADKAHVAAIQKANSDRVRALKGAVSDATKKFDVDPVTLKFLNDKLAAAEKDASVQVRPEGTVAFGGHRYALIKTAATWSVAKRRCEEMGGNLVLFNTPEEQAFVLDLCRKEKQSAWIGATDEVEEGAWKWIDGTDAKFSSRHVTNSNGNEHYMAFDFSLNDFNDVSSGRAPYVCEWN